MCRRPTGHRPLTRAPSTRLPRACPHEYDDGAEFRSQRSGLDRLVVPTPTMLQSCAAVTSCWPARQPVIPPWPSGRRGVSARPCIEACFWSAERRRPLLLPACCGYVYLEKMGSATYRQPIHALFTPSWASWPIRLPPFHSKPKSHADLSCDRFAGLSAPRRPVASYLDSHLHSFCCTISRISSVVSLRQRESAWACGHQ